MASQESYVTIVNNTKESIGLRISEVSSHDWDGNSRPDMNLNGKTINPGCSIREREEMNRFVRTCWYRLTITCKNGNTFSQRIDQSKSLEPRHTSTDYYYCKNTGYGIKTRTNKDFGKDNLVITIVERGKLPITRSSFSAGAIPVSVPIISKIAEHTYVFTDAGDRNINFPCWGDTNRNVSYINGMGDLELAIAIACYDPYDLRSNYNDHAGGIRSTGGFFGDCSGICYGRTGVCHQMANRIMYALDGHPNVGSFTPSYPVSFQMYGVYGKENWSGYLAECQNRVNRGRSMNTDVKEITPEQVKEALLKSSENMDSFTREAIRLEIAHEGSEELPNLRLKLLINTAFPNGYDSNKLNALMQECTTHQKADTELLHSFDSQPETKEEGLKFADSVNSLTVNHLQKICNILGPDDFEKVFGMKFDPGFALLNRELQKTTR